MLLVKSLMVPLQEEALACREVMKDLVMTELLATVRRLLMAEILIMNQEVEMAGWEVEETAETTEM